MIFYRTPIRRLSILLAAFSLVSTAHAAELTNPGFEEGYEGWSVDESADPDVALSGEAQSGTKSLKITGDKGLAQQVISVETNSHYELTGYYKGGALVGANVGDRIYFDRKPKSSGWKKIKVKFNTGASSTARIFLGFNKDQVRYDSFSIRRKGVQGDQRVSPNVISKSSGGTGLSPDLAPGGNFDLLGWNLSVPTDTDNSLTSDTISEINLAKGYQDKRFFYTAEDGGMVFRCPIEGFKTSKNTTYTRTELREMLRRGDKSIKTKISDGTPNKNNWVFSSAPESAQKLAGGVDGVLEATLAVNHVTTTGADNQVGRVIIGQIHAKDDEPIRLYYRKLPGNTHGSIYAAHESLNEPKDIYYEMIGTRSKSAPNPANGIQLNEKFSYKIVAQGNFLFVTISKDEFVLAETTIDMTDSGYDVEDDYMYFKAGVYNQNKSGDPDDYVQATFYKLKATHTN